MTPIATLVGKAARIAAEAHENQTDKAGEAYILHPLRLMVRAQTDLERIVALLHDVVEKTQWTLEQLASEGFPPEIIAAIDHLTRRDRESDEDFLHRTAKIPLSARIKLFDLEDNLQMTRLDTPTVEIVERLKKYQAERQSILQILEEIHTT